MTITLAGDTRVGEFEADEAVALSDEQLGELVRRATVTAVAGAPANRVARRAVARAGRGGAAGGDAGGSGEVGGAAAVSLLSASQLDEAVAVLRASGGKLLGEGGLLTSLVRDVLEAGLKAELTDHLGYGKHEVAGRGSGNSRNGASAPKTVQTEVGPIRVAVPRDRAGTFEPVLLPKNATRLGGFEDIIVSLYAGGMTVRDVAHHLRRVYGADVSADLISTVTDSVLEEVKAWQCRPLDEIYPIIYIDALVIKVRDGGQVRNKAAHLAIGIGLDGIKHVLGIWITETETSKFWLSVCTDLRNRGVKDVLVLCCDGLTGLPEAVEAVWPRTTVQTCTVHLIRASMKYVASRDRQAFATALRAVYTATSAAAAQDALLAFADTPLGRKYPAAIATWTRAWDRFVPFFEFPPELRKIIYTTNAIESFNYQIRKIIKNRGHFPTDDAAVKLIWLAILDVEDKRAYARARAAEKAAAEGTKRNGHARNARLVEGAVTYGWQLALNALTIMFEGRIPENAL